MDYIYKLLIGIAVLMLGFPLGNLLARATKEELKKRKTLFKTLIIFSLIGAFVSLFLREDILLFSLLFIAVVTSRSLKIRK